MKQTVRNPELVSEPFVETTTEDLHSVEVTRNAKGEYQWNIKMYASDNQSLKNKVETIAEIDQTLRGKYKTTGG
jgi:hypothetical protein